MNTSSLLKRSSLQDELYKRVQTEPELFDFMQSFAVHGLWYWDLTQPDHEWMNPAFWITLGYDPAEMPHSPQSWQHIIFEDDLIRVGYAVEKHLEDPTHPFDQVIRFRHRGGHTLWIRCRGQALFNEAGKPFRMIGGHVDVSQAYMQGDFSSVQWIDDTKTYTCKLNQRQVILNDNASMLLEQKGKTIFTWEEFMSLWSEPTQQVIQSLPESMHVDSVVELEWINAAGESNWIAWQLALGQWQNITLRKRHADSIQNARNSFERAISGANLGTWQWDLETNVTIYNDRWADMLGFTREELGQTSYSTWLDLMHPDDQKQVIAALKRCLSGEKRFYEAKYRLRHQAGHWVWIHDRGAVFSWRADGQPHQMFGTHQDISKSQQSFERLQIFIAQSPAPLVMLDKHLCFIAASDLAIESFSMKGRPMGKWPLLDVFPQDNAKWEDVFQRALSGETLHGNMDAFRGWNGQDFWLRWVVKPWRDEEGVIGGVMIFAEDQSERLALQKQLLMSEQTFESSFESSAIGMALLSRDLDFIRVNPHLQNLLGRTQVEFAQLNLHDLTPADQNTSCSLIFEEIKNGLRKFHQEERRIYHSSGELKHFILAIAAVTDVVGQPIHFTAQFIDITALKNARAALENSLAHLQRLLNASRYVSIIETNLEGEITLFNKGAENLLGYKADEVVGKMNPLTFHDPEEINAYRGESSGGASDFDMMTERSVQFGEEVREWTYVGKDGTRTPVQLHITPVFEGERVVGYLGVAMDIRRLKQTEKNNLDLLYFTQDQNKRLKSFAHIVSHNLRSHAAGIDMLLTLIEEDAPEIEENSSYQLIKRASQNLMETITHLSEIVDFNLSDHHHDEGIYIHQVVDQCFTTLTPMARQSQVKLINATDPTHHLFVTPAYLESIVFNFVSNGIKYSQPSRDSAWVRVSSHLVNQGLQLVFEDNGLGIDLAVNGHQLFGMYKTFHEHPNAKGLGLFMTKNQVDALGGKIDVKSEIGKGSSFTVTIPTT